MQQKAFTTCIAWSNKHTSKLESLTNTTSPFGKENKDKDKELTMCDCMVLS